MKDKTYIEEQDLYTTISYQAHESDEPIVARSVPAGSLSIIVIEDIILKEDFNYNRTYTLEHYEQLELKEVFVLRIAIQLDTEDTINISEVFEQDVRYAERVFISEIIPIREIFSYDLRYAEKRDTNEKLLLKELFDYRLRNREFGNSEKINIDEDFSFSILVPERRSEDENIIISEVFSFIVGDVINRSSKEVLILSEMFSHSISEAEIRSEIEILSLNELFNVHILNDFERSGNEKLNISEVFSTVIPDSITDSLNESISISTDFSVNVLADVVLDPPQNLDATANNSNSSISLTWNHPSTGQPDFYDILMTRPDGNTSLFSYSGSTTSAFYSGLADGYYEFQARSRSSGQTGVWSDPVAAFLFTN